MTEGIENVLPPLDETDADEADVQEQAEDVVEEPDDEAGSAAPATSAEADEYR